MKYACMNRQHLLLKLIPYFTWNPEAAPRICLRRGILFHISWLFFPTWREYFYSQPTNFFSQPTKLGFKQSSSPFTKPWTTQFLLLLNLGWLIKLFWVHIKFSIKTMDIFQATHGTGKFIRALNFNYIPLCSLSPLNQNFRFWETQLFLHSKKSQREDWNSYSFLMKQRLQKLKVKKINFYWNEFYAMKQWHYQNI